MCFGVHLKKIGDTSMFNLMIAWTPLLIAAAFAFVKIQNLSLLRLILLLMEKSEKPMVRSFGPRTGVSINVRTYFNTQKQEKHRKQHDVGFDKFQMLSEVLDEGRDSKKENPEFSAVVDSEAKSEPMTEPETDVTEIAPEQKLENTEPAPPVDSTRVSVDPPSSSEQHQKVDTVHPPDVEVEILNKVVRDISHPAQ